MADIKKLSPQLQRNVLLAAEDKDVQRLLVEAMFDLKGAPTDLGDLDTYIDPYDIANVSVRMALWGQTYNQTDAEGVVDFQVPEDPKKRRV